MDHYKINLFCKIFCLLIIARSAIATEVTDLAAAELGKILQTTATIKADFMQRVFNNHGKVLSKSVGTMAVKKPGLLRWQIMKPEPNLIVIDGKNFWNYDEELQQVTVQNIDDSYQSSPVGLFLAADLKEITKRYQVKRLHANCFELIPKNEVDSFKKVQLTFKNGIIYMLMLLDQLDQTSTIEFSNVQTNIIIDSKLFKFVPSHGVDVVGEE